MGQTQQIAVAVPGITLPQSPHSRQLREASQLSETPKEHGAHENWEKGICSHTCGKDERHQIHKAFPKLDGKAPSKAEGMIGRNAQK